MIVYNWKSNLNQQQAFKIANLLATQCGDIDRQIILAPPAIYLPQLKQQFQQSSIKLCAQNLSPYPNGAYTGEISAIQLKEIGCTYTLIGHSERRQHFKEDNEIIAKKYQQAINAELLPILCVGENLSERQLEKTFEVLKEQIIKALEKCHHQINEYWIAYEPTWAIGSGEKASLEQIEQANQMIVDILKAYQNDRPVYILYGGSVKSHNIKEVLKSKKTSGVLIGGASIQEEEIRKINQQVKLL